MDARVFSGYQKYSSVERLGFVEIKLWCRQPLPPPNPSVSRSAHLCIHTPTPRRSHSEREVVDLSSYDVCIELDVVRCAFLTPTSMLLSLRTGEVYALRLHLAAAGRQGTAGSGATVATPNRVVGQSMRPVGRASPCSVLAVSAAGGDGRRNVDGEVSERPSTGLVFMGSRVGDSLLVKYAVASAGAQPGRRGALVAKEPKAEEGGDREGVDQSGDGSAPGPSTDGAISGQKNTAGGGGGGIANGAVPGGSAASVKEEPLEKEEKNAAAASPSGMEVDGGARDSGAGASGGEIVSEPENNVVGDDGQEATRSGDAGAEVRSAEDGASPEMPEKLEETGVGREEGVGVSGASPVGGGGGVGTGADAPAATPTKQSQDAPAPEEPAAAEEGAGSGEDGSFEASGGGSAKRCREERSPSEEEDQEGEGNNRADRNGGDNDGDQPDKKRSRLSSSGADDAVTVPAEAVASASETSALREGEGDPVDGEAASPEVPSEKSNVGKVDAMDAVPSPPPSLDPATASASGANAPSAGSVEHGASEGAASAAPIGTAFPAENNHGNGAAATTPETMMPLLSREEQEMIQEEEALYGARIGSTSAGRLDEIPGAALGHLGSKGGERVIEAVGFRLRVRAGHLGSCMVSAIVEAAVAEGGQRV